MKKLFLSILSIAIIVILSSANVNSIKEGMHIEKAKEIIKIKPDFEYEHNEIGFQKFGVYGWKLHNEYVGIQTVNDTIIYYKKFENIEQYKKWITKE